MDSYNIWNLMPCLFEVTVNSEGGCLSSNPSGGRPRSPLECELLGKSPGLSASFTTTSHDTDEPLMCGVKDSVMNKYEHLGPWRTTKAFWLTWSLS